jgi:hypothetical protein
LIHGTLESSEYWLPLPASGDYFVTAEAEGYFIAEAAVYVDGVTLLDFISHPLMTTWILMQFYLWGEASGSPGSIIMSLLY